jgi:hypothetical protein
MDDLGTAIYPHENLVHPSIMDYGSIRTISVRVRTPQKEDIVKLRIYGNRAYFVNAASGIARADFTAAMTFR